MDRESEKQQLSDRQLEEVGLSTACVVFGGLSVALCVFGFGVVLGLAGLIACRKYRLKKFSASSAVRWGGILSLIGTIAGILFASVLLKSWLKDDYVAPTSAWVGVPAPDLAMRTVDGRVIHLSSFKGKRVALAFWATWCGPCLKEIPSFTRLYDESSRDELVILGISTEDEGVVAKFVDRHGINYPIATPTGGLPRPFIDIKSTPMTFVIDRKGIIQFVADGYHSYEELRDLLLAKDYQGEIKAPPQLPQVNGIPAGKDSL